VLHAEIDINAFVGPYCQKVNLSRCILSDSNRNIYLPEKSVTNGLILELKQHFGVLKDVVSCLQTLNPIYSSVNPKTINTRIIKITEIKKKTASEEKSQRI
jgi:hypothetical protein